MFNQPPKVKSLVPTATATPEKAPDPIAIQKDGQARLKRKRNPLRIDLAGTAGGATPPTGVNV